MIPWGRAVLAHDRILSRFGLLGASHVQVMHVPAVIARSIASEIQAPTWNKEREFNKEEGDSNSNNLPWVSKEARHLPSKEGGLSLLNWKQVKAWLQYQDGNRGEWKSVLDQWACRFFAQRGAPLSTVGTECILAPWDTRGSTFSKFFKYNLKLLKELHLTPTKHGS